ncbi:methenyltetrahydrofolate synthase domain-containing protein-like isoform X2 [Branchiostoma floridae x Branchiostoma belcheri]
MFTCCDSTCRLLYYCCCKFVETNALQNHVMSESGGLVESETGSGVEKNVPAATGVTKCSIRQQVWDHIEKNDLANFPRPVHHRIPNFKNAATAAEKITAFKPFQQAWFLKVDPDRPLENVRFLIMEAGKTLLVPTPRLRNGLFNRITPPAGANKQSLRTCATRQGIDKHSIPVGLDDMVKIDLVVCGSVAVSRKGYRIGKGEGYGDMEWAMLVIMGAVTPDTIIVTTVHDCQVIDIPEELVESHDITVDWILTPTEVIQTNCQRPKPQGIIWSKVDAEMLQQIPILRKLRQKERAAGKDVQIKAEGESTKDLENAEGKSGEPDKEKGVTKWSIRQQIWDHIEKNDLANFPRPVHHRIPNFKNAAAAAEKITALKPFQQARFVKVNPDKPQENVRFLIMEAGKTLLVPTPRLRNGLFNRITPPAGANKQSLRTCATRQGIDKHSIPVGLDDMVKIDLVVCGSVAVSRKGYRIGKGEGFGDMEWAMLVTMGAVTPDTIIVTTVHDCQVIDIPEELVESHDITVDWILTPTEVIQTNCQRPKPQGIIWSKVDAEMLQQIPILRKLRQKERAAGKDVQIKAEGESTKDVQKRAEEKSGEPAKDKEKGKRRQPRGKPREKPTRERKQKAEVADTPNNQDKNSAGEARKRPPQDRDPSLTLWVGKLPGSLRVSNFKNHLRESNINPLRVIWKGNRGFAFLEFKEASDVDEAVKKLQELEISGKKVTVERAKGREEMRMKKADGKPEENAVN